MGFVVFRMTEISGGYALTSTELVFITAQSFSAYFFLVLAKELKKVVKQGQIEFWKYNIIVLSACAVLLIASFVFFLMVIQHDSILKAIYH